MSLHDFLAGMRFLLLLLLFFVFVSSLHTYRCDTPVSLHSHVTCDARLLRISDTPCFSTSTGTFPRSHHHLNFSCLQRAFFLPRLSCFAYLLALIPTQSAFSLLFLSRFCVDYLTGPYRSLSSPVSQTQYCFKSMSALIRKRFLFLFEL